MNIDVSPHPPIPPCPACGSYPETIQTFFGEAYFSRCRKCGWEGGERNVEATPKGSLLNWIEKCGGYEKS